MSEGGVIVIVTDHCAERFTQRVARRRGDVERKVEIASRAAEAWNAGRVSEHPGEGTQGDSRPGVLYIRDLYDRDLLFVARHDRRSGELVLITLWERERLAPARVPRRFTDALAVRSRRSTEH